MTEEGINILITGDFYGGGRTGELIETGNYDKIFGEFTQIIKDSELAITNLESPLIVDGKPIQKSGPAIKANPIVVKALEFAGFNLVTLANNHILDYGVEGLASTIKCLDKSSIDYVGIGQNIEQARKVFYKNLNDTTIAIVNFCENEWSTTTGYTPGANPLNLINNYYDIQQAKLKADKVIVILHGGNELYSLPSPKMKELCRYFINIGADVTVCHHSHFYSGFENYKDGLIFYGLGNFIFDYPKFKNHMWNLGIALQLKVNKKDSIKFEIIPFKQCNDSVGIRLLDQEEKIAFKEDINELNKTIADDSMLQEKYDEFTDKMKSQYLGQIQPYANRYLYGAYKKGYLPSAFNKTKYSLLQNLIRCESHRDVLLTILNKKNI